LDDAEAVLVMFGYGGMSTDETETEGDRNVVKTLRHRDKPWHDSSMGQMWEAIEEYDTTVRKMEKKEKLGNSGLPHLPPMTMKPVSTSALVCFLLKNFYWPM
jgi:hypothetical protein